MLLFVYCKCPFLENIFTQQPSYYSDLDETVPTVLQVRLKYNCMYVESRRLVKKMFGFV